MGWAGLRSPVKHPRAATPSRCREESNPQPLVPETSALTIDKSLDLEVHVMTNHSREDDNQATGLPDLPKLIFLDTNIAQNLHSFGEFIFERVSTPDLEKRLSTLGPRVTADVYALADFMALGVSITTTS